MTREELSALLDVLNPSTGDVQHDGLVRTVVRIIRSHLAALDKIETQARDLELLAWFEKQDGADLLGPIVTDSRRWRARTHSDTGKCSDVGEGDTIADAIRKLKKEMENLA